jgi:Zn-dependent peptidase ImmA (M78 family)/DNA-binding XRE family transcriptional regulator
MLDTSINPDLLKVARQARAFSQAQLAEKSGVTQGTISKAESGLLNPAGEILAKLAAALEFPSSFFYEPDRVFGLPMSLQYRKKASVGQRAIEQLEADVNIRLFQLRRLWRSVAFEPEAILPRLDIDEFGDAERIAELVRRTWLVPTGPVRNLVELIEAAGCVVFTCDFQAIGVDGLTLQPKGLPTCIFINSALPADRQRFTLAHELGHIVMHQCPSASMEEEANTFAAALLMPRGDIQGDLAGGLTINRVAALKRKWKTSMAALIFRARSVGTITEQQSVYLWRQMSRSGYRTREPQELDFPADVPSILSETIKIHLTDLGYSAGDLSKTLHMEQKELEQLYGLQSDPKRPALRIVG